MTSRENARCQSDQIDIVVAHLLRQVHAAETYIIFFIVVWILYASYRFSLWKNNPSGKQVRALLSDFTMPNRKENVLLRCNRNGNCDYDETDRAIHF